MYDNRYVELTTRIRSVEAFCEFLSEGGVAVRVAPKDGDAYRDVTIELLAKHLREANDLRKTRRVLFPELSDEEIRPALYSRH